MSTDIATGVYKPGEKEGDWTYQGKASDEERDHELALLWEANSELQKEVGVLRPRVAELEREVRFYQAKHERYESDRDWNDQIGRVSSDWISPSQKTTARALRELYREGTKNVDGFMEVEAWMLERLEAHKMHKPNINYLSDIYEDGKEVRHAALPLFEKRIVTIPNGRKGRPDKKVFLKPTDLLEYPNEYEHHAQIRDIGGAGRGQGRPVKCSCGGDIIEKDLPLVKQRFGECNRCHAIPWADTPRSILQPQAPTLPTPPDDDPDGGGIKNQLDFLMPDDADGEGFNNQVDTIDTPVDMPQVDFLIPDAMDTTDGIGKEGIKNQLDFQLEAVLCDASASRGGGLETLSIHPSTLTGVETSVDTGGEPVASQPIATFTAMHDDVPEPIASAPVWVVWAPRPSKEKPGRIEKVPFHVEHSKWRQAARVNDPRTWGSLLEAQALRDKSQSEQWKEAYQGLKFRLTGDVIIVDFDDVLDAQGRITQEVMAWVTALNSYAERSPNGRGLHVICIGLPGGLRPTITKKPLHERGSIEVYSSHQGTNEHGHFLTWTGDHLDGTPRSIEEAQGAIDAIVDEYQPGGGGEGAPLPAGDPPAGHDGHGAGYTPVSTTMFTSDTSEAILEKARAAGNGAKFLGLFDNGTWTSYPSQSEADLALCRMLAYWTDHNEQAIDLLFRQSALYRPKWDVLHGQGMTYGEQTIRKAMQA